MLFDLIEIFALKVFEVIVKISKEISYIIVEHIVTLLRAVTNLPWLSSNVRPVFSKLKQKFVKVLAQ